MSDWHKLEPKEDITAFELFQIKPWEGCLVITLMQYEELPDNLKRHYTEMDLDEESKKLLNGIDTFQELTGMKLF